mgnify:CR=1 FL=1
MKRNQLIALFLVIIGVWSCRNDDDVLLDAETVPPRTMSEVAIEDDAEIMAFLQTHFYNYEEFENPPIDFDFVIKFDTIAGDNADKTPIISRPELKSVVIREESATFGREDGEEIDHTLYYLEARMGVGESPTIGDNVVLQYEGTLLDGTPFDGHNTPLNQYLSGGLIRGYSNGVEKLHAGTGPIENVDGTVSFEDFGVGAIFIPSGLGYFSRPPQTSIIGAYAPLIFKIALFAFEKDTDFDGDGIPSILEDLDGDGNLNNDNTDADTEPPTVFFPNHNDTDDDQDGIPTIDEIELDSDGNFVGFRDSDGDGIDDHLDNDN